jgi:hypothetical protein
MPKLSLEQNEALAQLAAQLLSSFESFDLEDAIRYGKMKGPSMNRELIAGWFRDWIPIVKARNAVKEILGAYDTPVYAVLNPRA